MQISCSLGNLTNRQECTDFVCIPKSCYETKTVWYKWNCEAFSQNQYSNPCIVKETFLTVPTSCSPFSSSYCILTAEGITWSRLLPPMSTFQVVKTNLRIIDDNIRTLSTDLQGEQQGSKDAQECQQNIMAILRMNFQEINSTFKHMKELRKKKQKEKVCMCTSYQWNICQKLFISSVHLL